MEETPVAEVPAEEEPFPKKKRQPRAPKPVRMETPEPPSYLEVLKRGLDIARHRQKAEKVARYDTFFQY